VSKGGEGKGLNSGESRGERKLVGQGKPVVVVVGAGLGWGLGMLFFLIVYVCIECE